jgi:hypothetical protein
MTQMDLTQFTQNLIMLINRVCVCVCVCVRERERERERERFPFKSSWQLYGFLCGWHRIQAIITYPN